MRCPHVAVLVLLLSGCGTTRAVRPVGAGAVAVGGSVGGPLFTNLGPPVPIPLTTLHARFGLDDRTDLDVGLHLPVVAATGLDAGASRLMLSQCGGRPALMVGGRLLLLGQAQALLGASNPNSGRPYGLSPRLFQEAHATASWQLHDSLLTWTGLDVFMQLEAMRARPSLVAGAEWRPLRGLGVTLEAKWLAFLSNQRFVVVDYLGPGDYGALGVQLGATIYLGGSP